MKIPVTQDECWTCGNTFLEDDLVIDVELKRATKNDIVDAVQGNVLHRCHAYTCAGEIPGTTIRTIKEVLLAG